MTVGVQQFLSTVFRRLWPPCLAIVNPNMGIAFSRQNFSYFTVECRLGPCDSSGLSVALSPQIGVTGRI